MPWTAGSVTDLEWIQNLNWCQVRIGAPGFVGFVRDWRLQALLEGAMQMRIPVRVEHDDDQPTRILRATVEYRQSIPPSHGQHQVCQLDLDERDGRCKIRLVDNVGDTMDVFTRDERVESLLTTAFRERWKIGNLSLDPRTNEINRVNLSILAQ